MNKMSGVIAPVCSLLMIATAVAQDGRVSDDRAEATKYGWVFNYHQSLQQARKTNRPMMLVFRCVP
jgi:hypothetical protein